MRRRRFEILALLTAAICLGGLFIPVWSRPKAMPDVALLQRGTRTNDTGALCVVLVATNRSHRAYDIAFATQNKPEAGWGDPSVIRNFNAVNGDGQLKSRSEREFLVPMPMPGTRWRVVTVYHEQMPDGWRRHWLIFRIWLKPRNYLKFLATPEMSSSQS